MSERYTLGHGARAEYLYRGAKCIGSFIDQDTAEEIAAALNAQQPQAATAPMLSESSAVPDDYRNQASGYRAGWNDCRAAYAAPQPQTEQAPPAAVPAGYEERMTPFRLAQAIHKAVNDQGHIEAFDAQIAANAALEFFRANHAAALAANKENSNG